MSDEIKAKMYAINQGITKSGTIKDPESLARHLMGFQSQILDTPVWSSISRCTPMNHRELKQMMEGEKRLLRTWTVRGTMHTICADDLSLFRKALEQEWFSRWSKYLDRHISEAQRNKLQRFILTALENGPKTRNELKEKAFFEFGEHDWVNYAFSSWGGILKDLSYNGKVIHGCVTSGQTFFVLQDDWVKVERVRHSPDQALAELLRRYLQAYSPATIHDFAYWSGVTVKRAKHALQSILSDIQMDNDYITYKYNNREHPIAIISLLPKFDSFLLAHKNKYYLPFNYYKEIFRPAAHVEAVILYDGMIIGTWKRTKGSGEYAVSYRIFDELLAEKDGIKPEIEREIARIMTALTIRRNI